MVERNRRCAPRLASPRLAALRLVSSRLAAEPRSLSATARAFFLLAGCDSIKRGLRGFFRCGRAPVRLAGTREERAFTVFSAGGRFLDDQSDDKISIRDIGTLPNARNDQFISFVGDCIIVQFFFH